MDNTLQTQVFEYIKEAAEKIGDFAQREIPPFVTEFLNWKFYEALAWALVWIVPVAIAFFGILTWYIKRKKQIFSDEDEKFGFLMVNLICLVVSGASFIPLCFVNLLCMLQILVAPKVYLLERTAEYLK